MIEMRRKGIPWLPLLLPNMLPLKGNLRLASARLRQSIRPKTSRIRLKRIFRFLSRSEGRVELLVAELTVVDSRALVGLNRCWKPSLLRRRDATGGSKRKKKWRKQSSSCGISSCWSPPGMQHAHKTNSSGITS